MPKLTATQREHLRECIKRAVAIQHSYMNRVCDTKPDFVTDLLTDLMHYAKARSIDFDNQLRIARGHFNCEQKGLD